MCGIAGVVHFGGRRSEPAADLVADMVATLRHRGPDEFGMYRDCYVGLGHARLSIIDVKSGQQPLCNERENLWITYNGEIFNYLELRNELLKSGHIFRTKSDTEVIVHAYEEWGLNCFERFNGQWALALWDSERRELILARDRMGICPLYLHKDSKRMFFASEVKALFADSSVVCEPGLQGLAQTFCYWGPVAPQTVFAGIEELPPATVRIYNSDGCFNDKVYWSPQYSDNKIQGQTLGSAAEELREKLERATVLRTLRSDVPVGSYLSGGIDSSVIAWLGRQAKSGEFKTYSIRFAEAEFDETEYQREMAARLESTHEELVITRRQIAEIFPDVIKHTERPILRTAPAPMFLLSRLVHQSGIKSVLTGEGADEVAAGYDIFREARIRRFWARQPESICRPALFNKVYPYLSRAPQQTRGMALDFWKYGLENAELPGFSHEPRWRTTSAIHRFFSKDVSEALAFAAPADVLHGLPKDFGSWSKLGQDQYLEIMTLFGPYLISSQGDRMLMANSVEGRFPFLDNSVMEFCNGLPASYKLCGLDEKHILKRAVRDIVPAGILERKKQPYRAPDAISFVENGAPDYVEHFLSAAAVEDVGIFDARKVQALYQKLRKRAQLNQDVVFSNIDNMALVGILSTQLLLKNFGRRDTAGSAELNFTVNLWRDV